MVGEARPFARLSAAFVGDRLVEPALGADVGNRQALARIARMTTHVVGLASTLRCKMALEGIAPNTRIWPGRRIVAGARRQRTRKRTILRLAQTLWTKAIGMVRRVSASRWSANGQPPLTDTTGAPPCPRMRLRAPRLAGSVFRGYTGALGRRAGSMVTCVRPPATKRREPRQARKGAAAAASFGCRGVAGVGHRPADGSVVPRTMSTTRWREPAPSPT